MQKEVCPHVGLSEVKVEEIKAAQKHFKVATVQNLFNLTNRSSDVVVDYCEQQAIGFIVVPASGGNLARPGWRLIRSPTATTQDPVGSHWRGY